MIEAATNPVISGKLVANREPTSGRIFFVSTPINYPPKTDKIVKAACWILIFFNRFQTCYTTIAEAMSFLHSSCSHLPVQTVPSSPWDAPCPVVTPSYFHRLGSALSAINDNYVLFSLQSRLRSVSTAEALRHSSLQSVLHNSFPKYAMEHRGWMSNARSKKSYL